MDSWSVEVEGVSKSFGPTVALDGVSLRVRRGELYALLGPNGSGKTTLIRMLVGLVRPDAGTVRVLDVRLPDIAVLGRIGYMTQQAALYPDLSVVENVRFFARLYGASAGVDEALRAVDLASRATTIVARLSGGMKTRVSLACALVHRPDLLLLDEPTVGIDPMLRAQLWRHFAEIAATGSTVIVSSHVMDEAERCGRLGLLRDGRLLAEGSATEISAGVGVARLEDAFLALAGEGRS